jgi:hypothetical protein
MENMKFSLAVLVFALSSASAQENPSYGLEAGSFGVFAAGGTTIHDAIPQTNGTHTVLHTGFDIGLHKYFGVYLNVTGTLAYHANAVGFSGGAMFTANNRSRIIPFARFGPGYGRGPLIGVVKGVPVLAGYANGPRLFYSGGLDAYVTRNFGAELLVGASYGLGKYGGINTGGAAFGVFYRTR